MRRIDIQKLGRILVTGGAGFVGSYLTRKLIDLGATVRVFDNCIRGDRRRLDGYWKKIEFVDGDITDPEQVYESSKEVNTIFHLAFINGTENFYKVPERVLEVGVKGALNTLDAAMRCGVSNYIVTSSSEVYHQPTHVPTTEEERLVIPDINNPRFSYSGGKIITELLAIHYPAKTRLRSIICRPHNFFGPDMGFGHVIPQIVQRVKNLSNNFTTSDIEVPIQGTGKETRAFCFIDDAIDGILISAVKGESQGVYHIGTEDEISISDLVGEMSRILGITIRLKKGEGVSGGTSRRCPSIAKIASLGYRPSVSLREGMRRTIEWYINNSDMDRSSVNKDITQ